MANRSIKPVDSMPAAIPRTLRDVKPVIVSLALDKERTLKFDLNAFAELEDVYGSMEQAFAAMQSVSMKAARTLLWAGLLHEDESLTPRKVGAMVTLDKLAQFLNASPPICVTLSGRITAFKLTHSSNALSPICVTLSGIVIPVKLLHQENTYGSMLVTLSGRATSVRALA